MTLWLLACTSTPEDTEVVRGGSNDDCREQAEPWMVVSKPFDGAQTEWATGTLQGLEGSMTLGRTFANEVAWTPDGQVGAVAHEDGSLSVWTREGPLAAAMSGEWYASRVVAHPSGRAFIIVDGNWPNNGGGLFTLPINCDNSLGTVERLNTSKLATDVVFVGDEALVVAVEVEGHPGHIHRLDEDWQVLQSAVVFDYEGSSPSDAELGPDGSIWVTDISMWGDDENRVVILEPDLSVRATVLVRDPLDIAVSDTALVLSGFNDEVLLVGLDGQILARASSELPTSVVLAQGGALVVENTRLRLFSLQDLSELKSLSPGFSPGTVGWVD